MKVYICYEDKGPSGPCGQDTYTTSHHKKLYVIEGTYDEIKDKVRELENSLSKNNRRSPKLTNYYAEGTSDETWEYGISKEVVHL